METLFLSGTLPLYDANQTYDHFKTDLKFFVLSIFLALPFGNGEMCRFAYEIAIIHFSCAAAKS